VKDANNDNALDLEEFMTLLDDFYEEMSDKFTKIDANKDGKLTFEEIKVFTIEMAKEEQEGKISDEEMEDIEKGLKEHFNDADTNGDEFIDEEEFHIANERHVTEEFNKQSQPPEKKRETDSKMYKEMEKQFKNTDKDNDGKVTKEEMLDFMKEDGYPLPESEQSSFDEEFKVKDANNDNALDLEEFMTLLDDFYEEMSDKFTKIDANKDGKLTFEEIKVFTIEMAKEEQEGKISDEEMEDIEKALKEEFNDDDTNGDEFIDEEEFQNGHERQVTEEFNKQSQPTEAESAGDETNDEEEKTGDETMKDEL